MKTLLSIVLLFCFINSWSQKGIKFPKVEGILLNDKNCILPLQNGKYSIIAIAYHRDAEDFLKQWLNPLYDNFMKKEKGSSNFDMAEIYDVNFIFIPMIAGFKRIAEDFKKGTDKEFWPYILDTEKTDIKELQKQLEVKDNKIPYFYVLDKEGKIVAFESGKFQEQKLQRLEEAIE